MKEQNAGSDADGEHDVKPDCQVDVTLDQTIEDREDAEDQDDADEEDEEDGEDEEDKGDEKGEEDEEDEEDEDVDGVGEDAVLTLADYELLLEDAEDENHQLLADLKAIARQMVALRRNLADRDREIASLKMSPMQRLAHDQREQELIGRVVVLKQDKALLQQETHRVLRVAWEDEQKAVTQRRRTEAFLQETVRANRSLQLSLRQTQDLLRAKVDLASQTGCHGQRGAEIIDDCTGGVCVACISRQAIYACLPCGHLSYCHDCRQELHRNPGIARKCPICKAELQDRRFLRVLNLPQMATQTDGSESDVANRDGKIQL